MEGAAVENDIALELVIPVLGALPDAMGQPLQSLRDERLPFLERGACLASYLCLTVLERFLVLGLLRSCFEDAEDKPVAEERPHAVPRSRDLLGDEASRFENVLLPSFLCANATLETRTDVPLADERHESADDRSQKGSRHLTRHASRVRNECGFSGDLRPMRLVHLVP